MKISVVRKFWRNILLIDGIEQTGPYTERLWKIALKPLFADRSFHPANILVFGVGGGLVFQMFQKAFPNVQMVGVDIDPEIIRIGKTYFKLDKVPRLTLITSDARTYTDTQRYDCIVIDLYVGNDVPFFVTQKPFLWAVERLLRPGGRMIMNYFREQHQDQKTRTLLKRLQAIYSRADSHSVLRNIFFYVVK